MLKIIGYNVLTAQGGREAVECYKQNKDNIDLLILDMVMPGMDGSETYDQLKVINPDVMVLLSSGYSFNRQVQEIIDKGCRSFIQKPFNLQQLSLKIREILDS